MAGEGGAAVLQVLVQNLIDLSKNEISRIRGLDGEAQKLSHNLLTIQQFLNDAETQTTIATRAVKIWLKRLENAAFEADNVLEISLSKTLNIKKEKEINMDLDSINESATKLGLQKIVLADAPTVPDAGRETDSFSGDPIFIGRDAWNEEPSKWEDFLNSLSGVTNTKGNAIIVTTRSMKVASIEGALDIHELKGLPEEDCWKIIRAKTFGNEDVPFDIESIGREIAKRCGGLPLAASVVGGVLRCDKSVDKWVSIRDDWLPEGEEEGENNITKILRLSFNYLSSPSLKKCFAYCSICPKGEKIVKDRLIELWMGEGFLQADRGNDMESMGDKFYNVLLHSSLLQKVNVYDGSYEDWCGMHDLVHDLASSVLGNADGVSRVRYLIHKQGKSSPIKKEVAQHLRTLIFQAGPFHEHDNIFSDFKSLHVLILKGRSFKELPRSIRKLIHLRNLNITETLILDLPDWIGELHHLQTLRAPLIRKLPSTIKYLINLRHLHVFDEAELPAEIGRLTSLQISRFPGNAPSFLASPQYE